METIEPTPAAPVITGVAANPSTPQHAAAASISPDAVTADIPSALAITRIDEASIASVVARGSVAGAQFHPERSAEAGRQLLRRFLAWDGR